MIKKIKKPRKPREQKARKSWDERMKQMRLFFLTHGHTQVLTRGENKELGRWLSSVRCKIRDGILPTRQVQDFVSMDQWKFETGVFLEQERQAMVAAAAQEATAAETKGEEPPEDESVSTHTSSIRRQYADTSAVEYAAGVPRELIVDQTKEAPASPSSNSRSFSNP